MNAKEESKALECLKARGVVHCSKCIRFGKCGSLGCSKGMGVSQEPLSACLAIPCSKERHSEATQAIRKGKTIKIHLEEYGTKEAELLRSKELFPFPAALVPCGFDGPNIHAVATSFSKGFLTLKKPLSPERHAPKFSPKFFEQKEPNSAFLYYFQKGKEPQNQEQNKEK